MRSILLFALVALISFTNINIQAQGLENLVKKNAVQNEKLTWKKKVEKVSDSEFKLIFIATAAPQYHFYSQYSGGISYPMEFKFSEVKGCKLIGKVVEVNKPKSELDDVGTVLSWEGTATFYQRVIITETGKAYVKVKNTTQVCKESCELTDFEFEFEFEGVKPEKPIADENLPNENSTQIADAEQFKRDSIEKHAKNESAVSSGGKISEETKKLLWTPIIEDLKAFGNEMENKSFLLIFVLGFLGGLVALMTPCVWPMIPMTVSFFIKKDKAKGKRDALIYGLSIIVIYMALALGITGIFGADMLNSMATSATFNIIFFVILVIFAASFLGAFELVLPTKWTNKVDSKAENTTGLLSIFLMAFTLVLVSFSCTGPIVGTLLVDAVTRGLWGPAFGMLGFSIALALPFTLFAFFPSMMKSMPKSGGWLNTVKVVLGFLELALALKFLSVADMAYHWRILDREVFLVLWIVIFGLLGMYLLGKIMFAHDSKVEKVGVFRLFLAMISLSFALYMVPGLWGAPLKAISAFSPIQSTQDFDLYDGAVHPKFYNYEDGMAFAREKKMPVLVDFTGYGCVNCRNMESAVWQDPIVKNYLENKYVLISLYVDDKEDLPKERQYISTITGKDGKQITKEIKTVGNLWSDLQIKKFGTSSQPYYFALDYDGKPLTNAEAFNLDINNYKNWLKRGLEEFEKREAAK